MNVIIVDDEPLAHEVLETYINQVAYNALEARELLISIWLETAITPWRPGSYWRKKMSILSSWISKCLSLPASNS